MNLSLQAARSLPLAAALMSGDEVVASTPEWQGPSLGCVTYVARGARLVVDTGGATAGSAALLGMLLDALDDAGSAMSAHRADRGHVLAASLRVLGGRNRAARGSVADVIRLLQAAVGTRTEVDLDIGDVGAFALDDPAVVALIAVQVVANAERHDGARSVRVDAGDGVITLSWPGAGATPSTARRREDRDRWGLGFARIAADSVGAVVSAPLASGSGEVAVNIDVGVRRLALPLCAVRDGRVHTSTAAWDEETRLPPGAEASRSERLAALCVRADSRPGVVVVADGWTARRLTTGTWVAIPPDDIAARTADVLDGLIHERALWDGVAVAPRARIVALAALAGTTIGMPLPRVTAMSWNAAAAAVAAALGYHGAVPEITGIGAVDPQVALSLAVAVDGTLAVDGDALVLHVPAHRGSDVLLSGLRLGSDGTALAL